MGNDTISTKRMAELTLRAKRCCCKYCGSRLEVRLIVFGKFEEAGAELFCTHCNRIEYGTEPLIYQHGKYFAETMGFDAFSDSGEGEQSKRQSVAKVCEIMMWHDTKLGILDENGFNIERVNTFAELDCADGSLIIPGEEVTW